MIPMGTLIHAYSPLNARNAAHEQPCRIATLTSPAKAERGVPAALLIEGGTRTFLPYDAAQPIAHPTNLDPHGNPYRSSWHRVEDCRWIVDEDGTFVHVVPPHPLDPDETIVKEGERDGKRIAITSSGRKVVLDADGNVVRRLTGAEYAQELA